MWVAVGAAAPGVIALGLLALLWRRTSALRAGQRVLLPDGASANLLDRQAGLQRAMDRLQQGVGELEALVDAHARSTEEGLRTSLRFHGMVRYDAYRDMGGQQSWSIALLDGDHTGSIISSLHARDHARVYLKEVIEGAAGQRLSPEEERALAMAIERRPRNPRPQPRGGAAAAAPAVGAGQVAEELPVPDGPPTPIDQGEASPNPPESVPEPESDGPPTGQFPAVTDR